MSVDANIIEILHWEHCTSKILSQKVYQVAATTRKTPLIVVPCHDFDAVRSHYMRIGNIHDRGIRIPAEVDRDEFLFTQRQYAFHRTFRRPAESGVDLFLRRRLLSHHRQVHDADVRRWYAQRVAVKSALQLGNHQMQGRLYGYSL